ncbi:MAG: hypothetical protein HN871_08485 [Alphaproteobacteria bacterium]|nr:hypothetical protein [Alphaproteobacteria bacterium]
MTMFCNLAKCFVVAHPKSLFLISWAPWFPVLIAFSDKNLFGKKEFILTGGVESEIVVDEAYLKQSIVDPAKDIVKDFQPLMPPLPLSDKEVGQIIEHIKELSE